MQEERERKHEQVPSTEPVEFSTFVRITLREIHSDLRGVKFYYDKKVRVGFVVNIQAAMSSFYKKGLINHFYNPHQTGMVKEHDKGLCDLRIFGKGMTVHLDVEPGLPVATAEKPLAHTIGA